MLFGYILNELFNEFKDGYSFFNIFIVFVTVIVESDIITIIIVNAGSGYNRSSKVTTDIFCYNFRIASVGFGINIESFFMFFVTSCFYGFKRRTKSFFQKIKKCGVESITEICLVKVCFTAPCVIFADATFRNQTVDMRIPFKVTTESMKYTYETGSKEFCLIILVEHMDNNTLNCLKKTV